MALIQDGCAIAPLTLGVGLLRQGRVEIVSNLRSHNWGNSNDRALVKMALIQDERRSHCLLLLPPSPV